MSRILLSLLLFLPGAALAGEAALVPDGSDCLEPGTGNVAADPAPQGNAVEAGGSGGEGRGTPRLQGSSEVGDSLPTPSWRSFLPGMLR